VLEEYLLGFTAQEEFDKRLLLGILPEKKFTLAGVNFLASQRENMYMVND